MQKRNLLPISYDDSNNLVAFSARVTEL